MPLMALRGPLPENKSRSRLSSPARIPGLQAFYNFEMPAPASQQPDNSGNNRTLTYQVTGGLNAAPSDAVIGKGVNFSSSPPASRSSGSKYFTTSWGPNVMADFSVSVWLRPRSFDAFQHIIGSPFNNGLYIGGNNTQLTFSLFNGTSYGISAPVITANTWHHYVFTRTSGILRLYADNVLQGTTVNVTSQSFTNASQFHVGGSGPNNEYYYDGEVDALGVWNAALTAEQVAFLWNSGRGVQIP
jgi:hypothetical protein